MNVNQIKSKERVADHGEVFTPAWMVEAMLDLVKYDLSDSEIAFIEKLVRPMEIQGSLLDD